MRLILIGTAAIALIAATHEPVVRAEVPTLNPAQTFTDNCAACHQEDGKGIEGAFPALAGDAFVVGDPAKPISTVLNGRGGMPTFKGELTDEQIAAALTHVRSSWGNAASPITPDMVKTLRNGDAPLAADKKPIQAH